MDIQISKAEWFAAHAPEPPEHFKPVMPDRPRIRRHPVHHFDFTDDYMKLWDDEGGDFYDPDNKIPQSFKEEVYEWCRLRIEEMEAAKKFDVDYKYERMFQWHVFYGNKMAARFGEPKQDTDTLKKLFPNELQ